MRHELAAQDRRNHRPGIALAPRADIDGMEKIRDVVIEGRRILEIDGVTGVRHDDKSSRRNRPLHQQRRFETRPVLVAGHDQGRHGHRPHLIDEIEQ